MNGWRGVGSALGDVSAVAVGSGEGVGVAVGSLADVQAAARSSELSKATIRVGLITAELLVC